MMVKTLILLFAGAAFYDGSVMAAPKDEEFMLSHDLGWFGKFNKARQNETNGPLECVYGHPTKGKFCPPVMEDPMAHLKEPPSESGSTFKKLTNGVYRLVVPLEKAEADSALAVFSRCLDDPDADGCRELQVGGVAPSSQVAQAPGHLRNLGLATMSPTVDDCGGNMFDPRFCASQMPSISATPTEEGEGGDKPSQARIVGTGTPIADGSVESASDESGTGAPSQDPGFVSPGPDESEAGSPSQDTGFVPPGPDEGEAGSPSQDPGFVPPGPDEGEAGSPSQDPGFIPPEPDEAEVGAPSQDPGQAPPGPDEAEAGAPSQDPGQVPPGPDEGEAGSPSQDPGFIPPGPDVAEAGSLTKDPGFVPPGPDKGEAGSPAQDPGFVPPGPDVAETGAPSQDPGQSETAIPTAGSTVGGTECVSREGKVNLELVEGNCPVDEDPVILASRTNEYAILEVFQAWDDEIDFISAIFEQGGKPVCATDKNVFRDATHETPLTYTVDCMEGDWAYLEMYVKNDGFPASDVVTIPSVCAGGESASVSSDKMCKYRIVVSCECNPQAPSSSPSFAPSFSPSMAPSFAPSSMPSSAPSSAPSAEIETRRIRASSPEGSSFCALDEFGCGVPNHVNICHYTSRIGYRTYCVPAADSDLVRFYATDYCGPCTGGYAVGGDGDTV